VVESLARVVRAVHDRAAGDRADHAVLAVGVVDAVAERAAVLGAPRAHDDVEGDELEPGQRQSGVRGDARRVRHEHKAAASDVVA